MELAKHLIILVCETLLLARFIVLIFEVCIIFGIAIPSHF